MSSSHCFGKSRNARRERVSTRGATVPNLTDGSQGKLNMEILNRLKSMSF